MKERKGSRLPHPIGPLVPPSPTITTTVPSQKPTAALKKYHHPSSDGSLPSVGCVAPIKLPRTRF